MKRVLDLGLLGSLALGLSSAICAAQTGQFLGTQGGDSGDERLRQIRQLIQSGHLDEARAQVEQALKSQSKDERLYNFLGVIDAQEKDFDDAESSFRRAIQIAPRCAE